MKVVVVESPAKAKTINKYLGSDYHVIASYGHIRDLPAKDGSVQPDEDFAMSWDIQARAEKQIKEIASATKGADSLILATDPDREGEAISWHVRNVLDERKLLDGVEVQRVVFNEITKSAILDAMDNPRDLDAPLIEAYLARRALDYLVGFTLSPVLWRKLPGSRSAGRVQSVALRLISEREAEIEVFNPIEYWSVDAEFRNAERKSFPARLTHLDGKKLDRHDIKDEAAAKAAVAAIEGTDFTVGSIERKSVKRNPQPPFTTSTLQQEASRKLGFGTNRTMQIAQRLYEGIDIGGETVGLITYMRTDGVQVSNEAISGIRSSIGRTYGDRYLPNAPRIYKSKAKNAQEAHEAIRPTDVTRTPSDMRSYLDKDMFRLYELIWKRLVASQMASAELDQTGVNLKSADGRSQLRANGSVLKFDGFLTLYHEDQDDAAASGDENDRRLPALTEGEAIIRQKVNSEQHFTQPPPRYSEASLVKKMEELGIGRPSTYASIIKVLQDRNYVRLENRRFFPEDRGRLVTAFLTNFFEQYVQYNFTADLETKLDEISDGARDWKQVLRDFWTAFKTAIDGTKDLTITEVLEALESDLGEHFFPKDENNEPTRACPKCDDGRLGIKLGKFGAFIGCSNYPDCKYTRQLSAAANGDEDDDGDGGPKLLGEDPESKLPVSLRKGPYGYYVQLGEAEPKEKGKKAVKPKRTSLPKGMAPSSVDLDRGLALLSLPRDIGNHPESGEPIKAGIGRFGPYVVHQGAYKSIGADDDVLTVGINRAVDLLATVRKKTPAKELGLHPDDEKPITVQSGRYGPYVQHLKTRATLPKTIEMDEVTLEQALELIAAKEAKAGTGKAKPKAKAKAKPKAKAKAKSTKTKTAAKKTPAKKTAAKKSTD